MLRQLLYTEPRPAWHEPRHARPPALLRAARRGRHLIALAVTVPLIIAVPLAKAYLTIRGA
jgi:hypothetical protein